MDEIEKRRYICRKRQAYLTATKLEKGQLLDDLCTTLELGRRQARRILTTQSSPGRPKTVRRGRPGVYQDREFRQALRYVWKSTYFMCSRHLKVALPQWLPAIEQELGKPFDDSIRKRLLRISAASIDRVLSPHKALKGKSTTVSGGFRDEIPLQGPVWNIRAPGYIETDTVAHCGGSTEGQYLNSLVTVDIATLWTEPRAVYGKASGPVVEALEDIERNLPFVLLGYDSDNGTEVLNQHILKYFQEEREERGWPAVQVTRSREYRKNDNCHVEQRNNTTARRWVGYSRMEDECLVAFVNAYYRHVLSPLMNVFFPTFKLMDKVQRGAKRSRVYDTPLTPCERVLRAPEVTEEHKVLLRAYRASLNPMQLRQVEMKMSHQLSRAMTALRCKQPVDGFLKLPDLPPTLAEFAEQNGLKLANYPQGALLLRRKRA